MGRDEGGGSPTRVGGIAVHLEPDSLRWQSALLRISRQDAAPTVKNAMWEWLPATKMSVIRYF
jgi:hypothetical protein